MAQTQARKSAELTAGAIVFRYVAEANPQGGYLPGVPLRDLTEADVNGVPAWLRPSLDTCPFYQRVGEE